MGRYDVVAGWQREGIGSDIGEEAHRYGHATASLDVASNEVLMLTF